MQRWQSAVQPLKAYGRGGEIPIQSHAQRDIVDIDHRSKTGFVAAFDSVGSGKLRSLIPLDYGPVGRSVPTPHRPGDSVRFERWPIGLHTHNSSQTNDFNILNSRPMKTPSARRTVQCQQPPP